MDNHHSAAVAGGDAPPTTAELDELIPAYRFIEHIDSGGMGAVYKAVQKSLNRTVAVKLLSKRHVKKEGFAARFKREAQAQALLNHPNIVAVYDSGETRDGQLYYVMEFVSGVDVQHLLRHELLTPRQIMQIITQVCDALHYAHERGIVHRDIKPANILIDERGNVKVADFGLAKIMGSEVADHTAMGVMLGTSDYIAPEAMEGGMKVDPRTDIYSLGVTIYELLTGYVPRGRWEPPSIRSGADKRMDVLVSRAMQHDADKRYQSVSEMMPLVARLTQSCGSWRNYRRRATRASGSLASSSESAGRMWREVPAPAVVEDSMLASLGRSRVAWAAAILLLLLLSGGGLAVAWRAGWLAGQPPQAAAAGSSKPDDNGAGAAPDRGQTPPVLDAQTRLVRWVTLRGGVLNVLTPENVHNLVLPGGLQATWPPGPVLPVSARKLIGSAPALRHLHDAPKTGPFVVWRISFMDSPIKSVTDLEELARLVQAAGTVSNLNLQGLDVPVEALSLLASMTTLLSLDVTSSPAITPSATPYLAACKQLKLLRLGGAPSVVDEIMMNELRSLLPGCGIHYND